MSELPDLFIHSVNFRMDDMIEVVYLESRNQTERAGASTVIVGEWEDYLPEIEELQETLRDLTDKMWQNIRYPKPSKPGRVEEPDE